jgi:hypothetical protein
MKSRLWLIPVLLFVCGLHAYFAAITIDRSNQDPAASDQGAEMWLAAMSKQDPFPQRTDGVRHPLFSWLVKGAHTEDQAAFFRQGKWINTGLAIGFLCVLGLAVSRWLDPLATLNLLLLCSLGILLVRGTYFQPEPLYYVLFFACAVLAWNILRGAPPALYPLFGVGCGLAFLAKPSLLPFLAAFVGALFLRGLLTLLLERTLPRPHRAHWLGFLLGLVAFAGIIAPLGVFSTTHFGKPFFNYPQYWMWMDDFVTEAWPWQDAHPGRQQLQAIPKDELPSASWYFKRHSATDAFQRLTSGTAEVARKFFFPEPKKSTISFFWRKSDNKKWEQPLVHRGIYLLALLGLTLVLAVLARKSLNRPDAGLLSAMAFVAACVVGYLLLYGWYHPIGRGDRFMGSLWIPLVFLLTFCACKLRPLSGRPGAWLYTGLHLLILLSLLLQIASLGNFFLQGGALTTRN